jgi:hypothetical protein
MSDFITFLVSFFLIEPLQAELADKLAAARTPQALVTQVTVCATTSAPVIVERAARDPWWATASALRLWVGQARPETVLVEAAPGCATAVDAARPFLTAQVS